MPTGEVISRSSPALAPAKPSHGPTCDGVVVEGAPPAAIIIAVMIGTTLLGGVLGGMLAIPLTAALRALMYRYLWKRG